MCFRRRPYRRALSTGTPARLPNVRARKPSNAAFLDQLESWRKNLARVLALRNPTLSPSELNFAVQASLDRIVFLRICEESGIEPYGRLKTLMKLNGVYSRLVEFFRLADDRYNSGLFHFDEERGRGGFPDRMTPGLVIDDAVLKEVIDGLYYPTSPYEFSVIPGEILGQVYEQFLGQGDPAHRRASGEDRREAGGPRGWWRFLHSSLHR